MIDRPREEVFEYLADIANHSEFSDHYLTNWHLLRVDSVGAGAGARFRVDVPLAALRLGRHDARRRRAAAPDRGGRAASASSTASRRPRSGRSTRRRAAARSSTTCSSPSPRCRPTGSSSRSSGSAPLVQAQAAQGNAPTSGDPRGGPGPWCARQGRRPLESAPDAASGRPGSPSDRPGGRRLRAQRTVDGRRQRGPVHGRRRAEVPDPDVPLHERQRRRGLRVPARGCRRGRAQPSADETWFGVSVRVQNEGDKTLPSADTLGDPRHRRTTSTGRSRSTRTSTRSRSRRASTCRPATILPLSSSAAGQGPIQGSLLLFKVKTDSLQNRPLELHFSNGQQGETGIYDLDV